MKKIAFLSLVMLVCGVDASFAAPAYKCQLKDLTGTPPNRNEYIYPYSGAYQPGERAQSRAIKCAGVRDNENCDNRDMIVINGAHRWDDHDRSGLYGYSCNASAGKTNGNWVSEAGTSWIPACGALSGYTTVAGVRVRYNMLHLADTPNGAIYCNGAALESRAGSKWCSVKSYLESKKEVICIMKSCRESYSDPRRVVCCEEERQGRARWENNQCKCEGTMTFDGTRCVQGNGGQGVGYGNGGGYGNGDVNANWNQNWNNNDANAFSRSDSSSQAGSLSSSESGASATNRNDINNRSGDSKSSAQGGNAQGGNARGGNSSATSTGGNVGDINIVNVINSCINEENNPTTCRQMREEPDCERDYAGFPELIACCIHQKVHLTTFAAGRSCQCLEADKEWDSEARTCMKKTKKQQRNGQSCAQKYASVGTERIACCNMGNKTIWDGQHCLCGDYSRGIVDPTLEFVFSGQQTGSYCRQKTSQDNHDNDNHDNDNHNYNNTPVSCYYSLGIKVRCKNGTKLDASERHMFTFAASEGVSTSAGQTCVLPGVVDVARLMQMFCQESGSTVYDGPDDAAVEAAKSSLQSFFQTAQSTASVWKNEDGQFNTARLASDATAGVVLGTVGGIVSAKVIKKKQLEKGYDALNCTIGGQKIADWGDEFQVGYSR